MKYLTTLVSWIRQNIRLNPEKIKFGWFEYYPTPTIARPSTPVSCIDPNEKNDIKNVITDEGISKALLVGKPPSLHDCISTAPTVLISESHKSNNHFFGLSTLLFIESSATEKPTLLCYHRIINPGEPGSPERIGCSILFHTSFNFRIKMKGPIDHWMELVKQKPKEAITELLYIPEGTLLKALNAYKWKAPKIKGTCEPFGVITSDLRATEGRIYTQYVFKTTLQAPEVSTVDDLKQLAITFAPPDLPVFPFGYVEPEFFLTKPSPKTMDYLALRGLSSSNNWISHGNAQFTRGFTIL